MRLLDLFVFKYNRTDFHELNLDWIISDMRTLAETLQNFISLNVIKYADPIQWNITTQYEANTVVVNPNDGTAYLSVQAVPSGVAITNTDYWTPIFTLNLLSANQNITLRDDGSNVLATFASNADDWLIWNATLYKVSQPIAVNEAYVVGYNLDRYSVELFIKDYIDALNNEIGALSDLSTTDKSSIVNAINELVTTISNTNTAVGDLNDLNTTDKSSTVNAINEVYDFAADVLEDVYYLNVKDFGAVGDDVTDDTQAIQDAIDAAVDKVVIVFPKGNYVINGTVNVNKSGITLMGVGHESTITRTSQTNTPVFKVNKANTKIEGFDAHDLKFANITNGCCFEIAYVFDSEIYRCFVDTIKTFVIYGNSSENNMNIWSKISNIIGNVTVQNSNFVRVLYNTNGVHIYECQINSEAGYNSKFISVAPFTDVDTVEIKDNLIQRMTTPIYISDTNNATGVLQNFFIEGNIIDSCESSNITANATTGASIITRFNINDNWFSCTSTQANNIVFTATSGKITQISFVSNIVVEAQERAFLVQGNNVSCIKILSNTFNGFNNYTPLSSIQSCVTIGGISTDIIISDNQFAPSSDAQGDNTYGIYIANGCSAVAINGNNLNGVTTPLDGTPTVASGNIPVSINT